MTAVSKKEVKIYSLMNVCNGNILSAFLNKNYATGHYNYNTHKYEYTTKDRKRSWHISQFNTWNSSMLDFFILGNPQDIDNYGFPEIWVKENEIDELYTALALSVLENFCTGAGFNSKLQLLGAFFLTFGTETFLSHQINYNKDIAPMIRKEKLGKQLLEFLDNNGLLQYVKNKYNNNKSVPFSIHEIELVVKDRKAISTTFVYKQ